MVEAGVSEVAAHAGAPPASSAASASPWLIAVLVALAAFMEVLDTTIANVVLPYIAGGMGVSDDEASWVVTTYLVANAVSLTASPFLARAPRPQGLLPDLPRAFQHKLDPVRAGVESRFAAFVPHPPRLGGRRHGAGLAVHSGGFVSAGEARASLCAVRRRGGGGAGGRPDPRRVAGGQLDLAVVLSDQRSSGHRHDRPDRHPPACGQT